MLINTKKPTGLPYGSGSLQIRGRVWWMIYKDGDGQTIQESAGTQDWDEAVRLLAARALPIAWARVAALERVAYEEAPRARGAGKPSSSVQSPRGGARQRTRRRSVQPNSGKRALGNRPTKGARI
jgi:hypothetical protein